MNLLSWKLAYRNLLRNKRRSLATGIAVLTGFVSIVLLGAYLVRSVNALHAVTVYLHHKGHLAVFKQNSLDSYYSKPKKYVIGSAEVKTLEEIVAQKGDVVEFTGKYLTGTGLISNGHRTIPFIGLGFEPVSYKRAMLHPQLLKWTEEWVLVKDERLFDAFIRVPETISITVGMGELLGLDPAHASLPPEKRSVQLAGKNFYNDLNAVNAELGEPHTTGLSLSEDTSIRAPLGLFQSLYDTDGVEYLAIFLKDRSNTAATKKWLQQQIKEKKLPLEVHAYDDEPWGSYYVGQVGFIFVMICFFVVLICGAIILSVVNSTTMGLLERLKEIGTLRAIGFSPRAVSTLFVQEMFLLAVGGVAIGLVVAFLISLAINLAKIEFEPPGTHGAIQLMLTLNTTLCVSAAVGLIVLTTVSAAVVSYMKNKVKIVELLGDSGA